MQKQKLIFWLAVSLATLWVGVFTLAKLVEVRLNKAQTIQTVQKSDPAGLTVYWDAPAFSFPDQDGQPVTGDSLHGHVWIADFFFSQCTSACPMLTSKLILLQKQISSPNVRFISFSVDPEHDSLPVLKKYAQLWEGDESRWRLLSTDPTGLSAVARGMKVTVAPSGDKDNPILHSSTFMLVDAQGQVRGLYESGDSDAMTQLVADAKSLDGTDGARIPPVISTSSSAVERGRVLFGSMGCVACHSQLRIAPPLAGVYGGQVRLIDHRMVWADDAYLHESIVDPYAKIVAGYTKSMPSYKNYLDDGQVLDLVAYIKSLSTDVPGGHGAITASTAPMDEELLIDPVCKMQVIRDETAPHALYKGRMFFFCSDHCREQFLKNPAQYSQSAEALH